MLLTLQSSNIYTLIFEGLMNEYLNNVFNAHSLKLLPCQVGSMSDKGSFRFCLLLPTLTLSMQASIASSNTKFVAQKDTSFAPLGQRNRWWWVWESKVVMVYGIGWFLHTYTYTMSFHFFCLTSVLANDCKFCKNMTHRRQGWHGQLSMNIGGHLQGDVSNNTSQWGPGWTGSSC